MKIDLASLKIELKRTMIEVRKTNASLIQNSKIEQEFQVVDESEFRLGSTFKEDNNLQQNYNSEIQSVRALKYTVAHMNDESDETIEENGYLGQSIVDRTDVKRSSIIKNKKKKKSKDQVATGACCQTKCTIF